MDWRVWLPVLDALGEAGFQTIAADVPGFGGSPDLSSDRAPTIQALAQAVASFLDELGLQRAHLVGNSMGGGIALELARAGRASSVTAISPVGLWTPRELRFCQHSLRLTLAAVRTAPALCACCWAARSSRGPGEFPRSGCAR
jgi:pimeloyl-ACP methyl ester carboxylesterase